MFFRLRLRLQNTAELLNTYSPIASGTVLGEDVRPSGPLRLDQLKQLLMGKFESQGSETHMAITFIGSLYEITSKNMAATRGNMGAWTLVDRHPSRIPVDRRNGHYMLLPTPSDNPNSVMPWQVYFGFDANDGVKTITLVGIMGTRFPEQKHEQLRRTY